MKKFLVILILCSITINSQVNSNTKLFPQKIQRENHRLNKIEIEKSRSNYKTKLKTNLKFRKNINAVLNKIENANSYINDYIISQWNDESSTWENSEHFINTYDSLLNERESIYQIWDNSNNEWINLERYSSEFDEYGNWISYLRENWNVNKWENYFLYSTSYNSQNLIIEDLLQVWNDVSAKWENYSIYKYEYDDNWKNTNYSKQDWNFTSSTWENVWQHVGLYQNDLLSEDLFQEWSNNTWQNSSLTNFTYDQNQNTIEQIIKIWLDNSTWGNSSKHTFVYDAINNNTEYYYEYWDDSLSTWNTWYRDLYTYDENNNQTGYLSEDWDNISSDWINYERAFFTYDENGFLKSELYQNWDSDLSDWVNSTKIDYVVTQIPTDVSSKNLLEITSFKLGQNYPNPFNPSTKIKYSIPNINYENAGSNVNVKIIVYDILGREIATIVNEKKTTGNYEISFDARQLNSGIYFYKLDAEDFHQIRKMILLK
jgi:hypothetical protein